MKPPISTPPWRHPRSLRFIRENRNLGQVKSRPHLVHDRLNLSRRKSPSKLSFLLSQPSHDFVVPPASSSTWSAAGVQSVMSGLVNPDGKLVNIHAAPPEPGASSLGQEMMLRI